MEEGDEATDTLKRWPGVYRLCPPKLEGLIFHDHSWRVASTASHQIPKTPATCGPHSSYIPLGETHAKAAGGTGVGHGERIEVGHDHRL